MIDQHQITQEAAALGDLLQSKLGTRGNTLAQRLNRAGRLLPKHIHKAGETITDAQAVLGVPKLMLQIDPATVAKAFSIIKTHLETIDPADRRKGKLLSLLGSLSFNFLAVTFLLYLALLWRGLI